MRPAVLAVMLAACGGRAPKPAPVVSQPPPQPARVVVETEKDDEPQDGIKFTHTRGKMEQAAIEAWLAHIVAAAAKSETLALEITECAQLLKGYGDTLRRGAANYATIERQVILPVLEGGIPLARGIDAVASARVAALADPEGESLAECLAGISQMRQAALPAAADA